LSFQGYSLERDNVKTPYHHPEYKAVLINSADGEAYLNYVFPQLPVTRFHLSIDPVSFPFNANKKRQICFTPRKNELVVRQVINILKCRDALRDFELVSFSGISQSEVSRIMQESAIFLSFGQYEGFGLPPAEAMACGCVVIGYHAGGGLEFFNPEFSYPIEYGDILGYAATIEQVIQSYDTEPEQMAIKSRAASEYVIKNYSKQQEETDIVNFWKGMIGHDN
jgi:glycosyltransferase involved in cell wall biosynthesis